MSGTFALTMFFKWTRNSRYGPTWLRHILSDFSVTLSIVIMVLVDYCMGVDTPKLNVPDTFRVRFLHFLIFTALLSPDDKRQAHLVGEAIRESNLGNILCNWTGDCRHNPYLHGSADNSCHRQPQGKQAEERRRLPLGLAGVVTADRRVRFARCGALRRSTKRKQITSGLPIFVAAPVPTINHVNSLKIESTARAPGEPSTFVGVR